MPARVYVNVPSFPDPLASPELMREVGDLALRMIRTRTEAGLDVEGRAFQAYTPGYAERKGKEGLGATPNLTVSGRMLNDMGIVATGPGVVSLGFRSSGGSTRGKGLTMIQRSRAVGAADKAQWHHVTGAGKSRVKRPFFGLTPENIETIRARVARYLDEIVRRAGQA